MFDKFNHQIQLVRIINDQRILLRHRTTFKIGSLVWQLAETNFHTLFKLKFRVKFSTFKCRIC